MIKHLLPLLLLLPFTACRKQLPPVSNFKVEQIAYGRAAIFGPETSYVLDAVGNYTPGVLDSSELDGQAARAAVTTLLAGKNYTLPDYSTSSDGYIAYGVLCHTPHFIFQAYDSESCRSNLFTICFTCGNVRMTNYCKYSKDSELMISQDGKKEFMALQDNLFPAYKGTQFWDLTHRIQK